MADLFSPVNIILDAYTRSRRVQVGASLAIPDANQQLDLDWGSRYLFTALVCKGDPAVPYSFATGTTFLWGLDDTHAANADPVISLNAQFCIPGDAIFDPANGLICWRTDLATSALKSVLLETSNPSTLFHSYLWAYTPDAIPFIVAKWEITIWLPAVDPVTATAVPSITDQANLFYVPIWGDGAYERRKDGRTQVLFPDGKWRSRIAVLRDGQPAETWGEPED